MTIDLTPRERQAVELLGAGRPYKVAAGELGISIGTLSKAAVRAFRKLRVRTGLPILNCREALAALRSAERRQKTHPSQSARLSVTLWGEEADGRQDRVA